MPFELCNARATFQRAMEGMLEGLDQSSAYVDDILTHSKSFEEHLDDLEQVFICLRKENLKAKPKKCKFGFRETKFLGFIISKEGLKVDPTKTDAMRNYPAPTKSKDVKKFLGLASYYRKFIEKFSDTAEPLTKLTRGRAKFEWNEICQKSYEKLKNALITAPVLIYPDFKKRFRITTDASDVGISAILSQVDEFGNDRPICYASRTLQAAERNYHTTEKELLAIVWGLERFRPYVFGVEFDLITDHQALTYITDLRKSNSRINRWRLSITEYSYKFAHKPGVLNTNADALSRMFEVNSVSEYIPTQLSDQKIREMQQNDDKISKILDKIREKGKGSLNNYILENQILFSFKKQTKQYEPQYKKRLVIPEILIPSVLELCHDGIAGGHLGENKTWKKVTTRYYWENMRKDTQNWVQSCLKCASKKKPPPHREKLHSLPQPNRPFERIGIDFIGPLPDTENGFKHLLVITDYCTRWAEVFPTKDQKASTVAKILIDEIICRYSAPRELLSDQGKNFLSQIISEICKYFVINKINTTSYHPQTNGLTERFNGTLCKMLSNYVNEKQTNWDIYLPIVLFAYRTSEQKSTKESPFKLLFAHEARLPADFDKWYTQNDMLIDINQAWRDAKFNIEKAQLENERVYNKKYENVRNKASEIKVGDMVRLENPVTKIGRKKKLRSDLWKGPFKVTNLNELGNVQLQLGEKINWFHKNRVKPAEAARRTYVTKGGRKTNLINYKE